VPATEVVPAVPRSVAAWTLWDLGCDLDEISWARKVDTDIVRLYLST
jgi:hypothetical protein